MLYLFSSAYRRLYLADVLNVLALPQGSTIVHRYRFRGDYSHVQQELLDGRSGKSGADRVYAIHDFSARVTRPLRAAGISIAAPAAVTMLFVDRDHDYFYYPLRQATLVKTWERDNRLYFQLQLGLFAASDPKKTKAVSERIKEALKQSGPHSDAGATDPTRDGAYAILGTDVIGGCDDILTGEDAWNAAVESLSKTTKFASSPTQHVVFARASLEQRGSDRSENPRLSGWVDHVQLHKDTPYDLRLSYRCADKTFEPPKVKIAVERSDTIQMLEPGPLLVQASADDTVLPFVTKRYTDERYAYIKINTQALNTTDLAIGPELNLSIVLREKKLFWLAVATTILIFSVSSLVIGTNPEKVTATSIGELPRAIYGQVTWWRSVAVLIQSAVLFVAFRIMGKKPV